MPKVKVVKASDTQVGGDHYKDMAIEPGIFCQRNELNCFESLVIKYVARHGKKDGKIGGRKDINKAIHCLQLILEIDYEGITED